MNECHEHAIAFDFVFILIKYKYYRELLFCRKNTYNPIYSTTTPNAKGLRINSYLSID